ncbi:hypothetical protein PRIPAC_71825 [Pristionchus pacificus]|nr:hypothetical protein PRIPAC_71825 [Pristionchus pacificus]
MSDSEDDEFVSASEGEEEDSSLPIYVEKSSIDDSHQKEDIDNEEDRVDSHCQSDGDHSEKEEKVEKRKQDIPAKEEHIEPVQEESEVENVEMEVEKNNAVNTIEERTFPDISSLTISEEPGRKESTSTSSGEGKEKKEWEKVEELEEQSSLDEEKSGWDDWGEIETTNVNQEKIETIPVKEEDSKNTIQSKVVEDEESVDGWDDWGNDEVESKPVDKKKETVQIPSQSIDDFDARKEDMLSKLGGSSKKTSGGSGWGWGGMLSGIGETFSSAVESSLGLPSAQELARKHAEIEKMEGENPLDLSRDHIPSSSNQQQTSFGGFGVLSGLVHGGIDVLESIGKKTFETITVREEEKGRRRFIFEAEKGENLSDVLKELREKNEAEAAVSGSAGHSISSTRLPDMASSFERSDGMVHLEALELVATNRPKQRQSIHRQLMALLENERVDAIDNDEEFANELRESVKETGLPYAPDGIINIDHELETRLRSGDGMSSEELFKEGVDSLVQFTAASVHLVSKLASLVAVMGGSDFTPFVSIYRILSTRCTHIANLYMLAISASDSGSSADELGTQVLVEASTAIDFIRQAHALVIPIIEVK